MTHKKLYDWQTKKLGEVCKLIKGKKPSKFVSKSSKPYLTAKVVRGTEIPEYAPENCPSSVWVKKEDIIIIMDGSNSGEMFTGLEGALASTMGIVEYQKDLFNPKYLLHFLTTHRENFTKSRTGSAIPHLNKEEFENLEIPLPPLPEQYRIVKILDEVFADVAKAKENAQKNLQNAKELFESYLKNMLVKQRKDWEEKKLEDIAFVKSGGTPLRSKKEYWEGNIAWYSSGELNDLYTKAPKRYINEYAIKNSNAKIFPKGSLLIGMYDTAALKMSIIDRNATFNQAIAGVKPNNKIDLQFIFHVINSTKKELLGLRRGTRQKNLNLKKIKNISIPFLTLIEQKSIVAKLDALSAETKKLEAIYKKKIEDLEELKKSVLKKAFSGEL